PGLVVGVWIAAGIATAIVVLRFVAKIRIHHLHADDVVMLLALVLAIIATALLTVAIHYGFGKSSANLSLADQIQAMKFATILQTFMIIATGLGRCAFILYLLGIVGTERLHHIILWLFIALQIIINGVSVIIAYTQCSDVRGIWNPEFSAGCSFGNLQGVYGIVQTSFNSFTDLYLAVFPIFKFWSLKLRLHVKICLIFLLSLGLLAMLASIGRTVELSKLTNFTDRTRQFIPLARWTIAECYLIIVTASLPSIRSLLIFWFHKISRGS
ncbi:hypothetical protein N7481_010155, partial [Penicillium waksmanii]|uniref:uncharacterized protein n=1 Tax=Penicillium waksmanii TaxID=69791 RepID=UPI0025465F24